MLRMFFHIISIALILSATSLLAQTLSSAKECQECHGTIYAEWKASRHAVSANNPFYTAMLKLADKAKNKNPDFKCQQCHVPASTLIKNYQLSVIADEGVSCDICHATRVVKKGEKDWFEIVGGNVKTGPIKDAVAATHASQYDATHESPRICLTCHSNAATPHGIAFCSTEEEWKESSFAKQGVSCQDCHMPSTEGKAAPLGKIRDNIHSHAFYGGYSETFLRDCASIELQAQKNGDEISVTVRISNKTVGHSLPTGSPMRMVILALEARNADQQPVWKNWYNNPIKEDNQAVFMRLLQDDNGKAPVPPWEATGTKFDHRLKADETRILQYTFSDSSATSLHAKLTYLLAPPPLLKKLGITDELYTTPKQISEASIRLEEGK